MFIGLFLYTNYFFTFDNLEGEFYKGPVNSPTEEYTANAYYRGHGSAAEVLMYGFTYNDEDNKVQTVYYSDAKSNFSIGMDE